MSYCNALIIQPGAVGDGVLTLPLISLLKGFGVGHVDVMGHRDKIGFLEKKGGVDKILSLEEARLDRLFLDSSEFNLPESDALIELFASYDLIVTFLKDDAGHFEKNLIYTAAITHAADVVAMELLGAEEKNEHVSKFFIRQVVEQLAELELSADDKFLEQVAIDIDKDDIERGRGLLKPAGIGGEKIIVIHPGSGGQEKCWPLENFIELANRFEKDGFSVVFLLGPVEKDRWDDEKIKFLKSQTAVLEDLDLQSVADVLSCCDGFVGNDSGPGHLASVLGVATVTIFGPSRAEIWRPLGRKVCVCQCSGGDDVWCGVDEVFEKALQLIVDK